MMLLHPELLVVWALERPTAIVEERDILQDIHKALQGGEKEYSVAKAILELRWRS